MQYSIEFPELIKAKPTVFDPPQNGIFDPQYGSFPG